jgi:hypothetical protein
MNKVRIMAFAFLVLFFSYSVQAQESAHPGGGDGVSTKGSVAFSIGQVVYSSYTSVAGTEGQGVQQRYELVQVKSTAEYPLIQTKWSIDPKSCYLILAT